MKIKEVLCESLPRWSTFNKYQRHAHGSFNDIYHYMWFLLNHYRTAELDITGDEIASSLCNLYSTSPSEELEALMQYAKLPPNKFKNWTEVYAKMKDQTLKQQRTELGG